MQVILHKFQPNRNRIKLSIICLLVFILISFAFGCSNKVNDSDQNEATQDTSADIIVSEYDSNIFDDEVPWGRMNTSEYGKLPQNYFTSSVGTGYSSKNIGEYIFYFTDIQYIMRMSALRVIR